MLSMEQQQQPQQINYGQSLIVNESKEDKIAAARQKLKQFKKKETKRADGADGSNTNGAITDHVSTSRSTEDVTSAMAVNSGRSTPQSTQSIEWTSKSKLANNIMSNVTVDTNNVSPPSSKSHYPQSPPAAQFGANFLTPNDLSSLSPVQFKEQLQLHVQTIGILVAEKAELQSKLHQQTKKCDKKQDECDELMGRLKVSRQKITDLEKLIQQMNHTAVENDSQNGHEASNTNVQKLLGELSSKDFLIDEIRQRLAESQEKLTTKQHEVEQLAQLTVELKSQLEISQLKVNQLLNQTSGSAPQLLPVNSDEVNRLQELNASLEAKLAELRKTTDVERENIREEAKLNAQRSQKQVENLVDQINRMTDEREELFQKVDKLESLLSNANDLNKKLSADVSDLNGKLAALNQQSGETNKQRTTANGAGGGEHLVKIDLLENEIKYFKQQIEILLKEEASLRRVLADKEQSIVNLNKLAVQYESDREKYQSLLEQNHNDKQTISRILTQNNELKSQLSELQDAYVKLSNMNLDLTTRLQSEEFKVKQLTAESTAKVSVTTHVAEAPAPATASGHDLSTDWDDDAQTTSTKEEAKFDENSNTIHKPNSLIDNIKQRLQYLEKENKDLNDYITLMNKQMSEKQEQQNKTDNSDKNNNNNQNNDKGATIPYDQSTSMKLLEEKFTKVMKDNADLKEKNQQLEHIIQQLQFETETIVDYITMYQMERSKLNEKYKAKDEIIRSLSTQLQVNKLALIEINNYLNAYLKIDAGASENGESKSPAEEENQQVQDETTNRQKREFLLVQMQSLLLNLITNSYAKLTLISNSIKNDRLPELRRQMSRAGNGNLATGTASTYLNATGSQTGPVDPKSIQNFKNETVLCCNCYGDLFVV